MGAHRMDQRGLIVECASCGQPNRVPAPHTPWWLPPAFTVLRRLPVGRYWLFHRLRRFIAGPFLAQLADDLGGQRFECDPRDSVASEVAFTGRYEPQETQVLVSLLRDGDVFVDAGANWGYFTLVAAPLVGEAGRVVAFEPEPRLSALLASNIARNGLTNAYPKQLALAAAHGSMALSAFHADSGNWGVSRRAVSNEPADFHCPTGALDEVLDGEGVGGVQLVKIDVEGGEVDLLAGMQRGLARGRYRHVLLECHPELLASQGIDARVCVDRLAEAGYRTWIIDHSSSMHARAATALLPLSDMMRPYSRTEALPTWPHLFAVAPGVPDPS